MPTNRNFLANTIIYFVGCVLSIFTLILFTQIVGLNIFNLHSIPGFINVALLPLILSVFIGYAVTFATYQSQKKYVALSVSLALIIFLTAVGIYYSYTCQELACLLGGYIVLATYLIMVPLSASIPVFFPEFPIAMSLIFLIIITILITGATTFRGILSVQTQKTEAKKEQSLLKTSNIPIYDTNYSVFKSKTEIENKTSDLRNKNLPNKPSLSGGDFSWLNAEGYYIENRRSFRDTADQYQLDINEFKPAKNFTDDELASNDLQDLKKLQNFEGTSLNVKFEQLDINNYPAILTTGLVRNQELRIYRNGIIIQIDVSPLRGGNYPKEEYIKLGQSLYIANQ